MAERIEASSETLARQATETAEDYLIEAVRIIDHQFGQGYAQTNPSLVAAFIQAASIDYGASIIAQAIGDMQDR